MTGNNNIPAPERSETMRVKASSVLTNWPYFYPRDTFTIIKAEEHMSLLETDTGARQWVGNSFLLNIDGSALETPPLHKEVVAAKHSDACGCGYCT